MARQSVPHKATAVRTAWSLQYANSTFTSYRNKCL